MINKVVLSKQVSKNEARVYIKKGKANFPPQQHGIRAAAPPISRSSTDLLNLAYHSMHINMDVPARCRLFFFFSFFKFFLRSYIVDPEARWAHPHQQSASSVKRF